MTITAPEFGLKLERIPVVNIRMEFKPLLELIQTEEFRAECRQWKEPIRTPFMIWGGFGPSLLTFLLQRSILGLESYVTAAVLHTGSALGAINQRNVKLLDHPHNLGGTTADVFFNRLPGLALEDLKLKTSDPELWKRVLKFYAQVRNPLFHGCQVTTSDPRELVPAFELIRDIYKWIDGWFPLEQLIKGGEILGFL